MIKTGSLANKIIEDKGLKQQSNPEEIKDYKKSFRQKL